jgi:hypothetical protein
VVRHALGKDHGVDERRFDTWTRVFAQSGSRRRLLRAVVGAGGALVAIRRGWSDTVAHHGMAGPGDPCRTDSQCVAADAPMACDWNGYSNGLSCCTYEGSNCADDTWCCGTNLCIGGTCTSQSSGCTGEGCACYRGWSAADPCDPGLVCCLNGVPVMGGNGGCVPQWQCPGSCTGQGCDCTSDGDCDAGLMCCVQGDPGAPGTCQTLDACPGSLCTGEGCDCDFHDPNACQDGLMCCAVQSGFICATAANCGG